MNWGSLFFAEIVRTISSSSPGGVESDSTAETNPYGYARSANSSMIFWLPVLLMRCPPSCLHGSAYPYLVEMATRMVVFMIVIETATCPRSPPVPFRQPPPPRRQYRGGPPPAREPGTRSGRGARPAVPPAHR